MKKIFLIAFSFFITVLIVSNCSNSDDDNPSSLRYPANVGNEWRYSTTDLIIKYDTLGNLKDTLLSMVQFSTLRVHQVNVSIDPFDGLIEFNDYLDNIPSSVHKAWYSNSDTGFFSIAYQNPGVTPLIIPKMKYVIKDKRAKVFFRKASINLSLINPDEIKSDSIQFWNPPRKVLHYPMSVGQRWVELIYPFYRERIATSYEVIDTKIGLQKCFKLEHFWPGYEDIIFIDYVSLYNGLLRREIFADSIAITTPENPDGIGWAKALSITEIKSKNF